MSLRLEKLERLALSLLRVVAGFLFLQHGGQKMFGWFGGPVASPGTLFWFAGLVETVGGAFVLAGWLTRPVALFLAVEMAFAYLIAHRPQGSWPLANGGVVALQFLFIFLHIAAAGPGSFALDEVFFRGSRVNAAADLLLSRFSGLTLVILRAGSAFLFVQYGASKIFGFLARRRVQRFTQRWVAGIMELAGAPLIAVGLFTRPVAFVLAGEMAVAYWTSHYPRGEGFWPIQNGGEPAVLFCFTYLYLVASGAGRLSLDALRRPRSTRK